MLKALVSIKYFNRFQYYNILASTTATYQIRFNNFSSSNVDNISKNNLQVNYHSSKYNGKEIKIDNNNIVKDSSNETESTPFDLENEMFLIRKRMMVSYQNGNYKVALDYALDLEDRTKKLYPNTKNAVYASCLNNSALMLKTLGEQESAIDKYIEALQVYESVTGKNHSSYASTLANLGVLYKDMSRQKKGLEKNNLLINSKEALQDALELRIKLLGQNHKDTVYSSIHLASYHRICSINSTNINTTKSTTTSHNKDESEIHMREAEQLLVTALVTAQTNWGEIDVICATIHNDLGLLYKSKLQYNEAKDHYLKALNIRSKILGDEHPETIVSLHNLAELYNTIGDTENEGIIRKQLLNMIQLTDDRASSSASSSIVIPSNLNKSSMINDTNMTTSTLNTTATTYNNNITTTNVTSSTINDTTATTTTTAESTLSVPKVQLPVKTFTHPRINQPHTRKKK